LHRCCEELVVLPLRIAEQYWQFGSDSHEDRSELCGLQIVPKAGKKAEQMDTDHSPLPFAHQKI